MKAIITLDKGNGQRWVVRVKIPTSFLSVCEHYLYGATRNSWLHRYWGKPCIEHSILQAYRVLERSYESRRDAYGYIRQVLTRLAAVIQELGEIQSGNWIIPLDIAVRQSNQEEVSEKEVARVTPLLEEKRS